MLSPKPLMRRVKRILSTVQRPLLPAVALAYVCECLLRMCFQKSVPEVSGGPSSKHPPGDVATHPLSCHWYVSQHIETNGAFHVFLFGPPKIFPVLERGVEPWRDLAHVPWCDMYVACLRSRLKGLNQLGTSHTLRHVVNSIHSTSKMF